MSFDDDLRRHLRTEAEQYDPAEPGLDGIRAGVGAAHKRRRRLRGGALGALLVAVALVAVGLVGAGDEARDVQAGPVATGPDTTEPEGSSPTTEPEGSSPTTEPTVGQPEAVDGVFPGIWPYWSQEQIDALGPAADEGASPFADPVATAERFARDYLGMLDPVVGEAAFLPDTLGDLRNVEVRPQGEDGQPVPEGGPSTVVTLRAYPDPAGGEVWTVVGAESPNVVIAEPEPRSLVTSPLAVRGEATGYEATVVVDVRQDGAGAGTSLGRAVGMAGTFGELAPLLVEVAFDPPTEPAGALVAATDTGRDGVGVPEATVIRLGLTPAPSDAGESQAAACSPPLPEDEPGPDEMEVSVFLSCDEGDEVTFAPVTRSVPRTEGLLRATLEQLFLGPTQAERDAGLSSFFRAEPDGAQGGTANLLADVSVVDGTAVVDLAHTVNNASTSFGSTVFLGQLNRTILAVPGVERVEYRLNGSCQAFGEWMQSGRCQVFTLDGAIEAERSEPVDEVAACADPEDSAPAGPDEMEVTVFLVCAAVPDLYSDEAFVASGRIVPRSNGVLRASLGALFDGVTEQEADGGLSSMLPSDGARFLRSVAVVDGTAVVDIDAGLVEAADGIGTSTGSSLFLGALNRTVFQFPTVDRAEYRLDGSCEAFGEWLQYTCQTYTRE